MIRCPRCGAEAPWGAAQCPRCFAPFVAPPTPEPPTSAAPPAVTTIAPVDRTVRHALLFAGLGLVAVVGILFLIAQARRPAGSAENPARSFMVASAHVPAPAGLAGAGQEPTPPPVAEPESAPSDGMFKVTGQANRDPVVAIGNGSPSALRFNLMDAQGQTRSEWIPAGESKDLTVPEGAYTAYVDAPDNPLIHPNEGTVNVKNFHHYEADFVIANEASPAPFYIGD